MLVIPGISSHRSLPNQKPKKTPKILKKLLILLLGIVVVSAITLASGYTLVYIPAQKLVAKALDLKGETQKLKNAIDNKDLKDAKVQIDNLKNKLSIFKKDTQQFSYLTKIPYTKTYFDDSQRLLEIGEIGLNTGEIVIKAIEPYQDFLGLKGSATNSMKTTEDRITFLTQSIEGLLPYMDSIETNITNIDLKINEIDINKYPETIKDVPVRKYYQQVREILSETKNLIQNGRPILSKTSWLLGKDNPRNYLVIFQNEGELRPSGGFWTAYATIKMDKGKVIPGTASNIYDLDDKLQSTTPAPRLIKSYHINVPYLNLRDSNLSPDFPTDARVFLEKYYQIMGKQPKFDAVFALDTNLLVDIVKVLGKLDTRVGTFTAEPDKRCDGCPKIIYDLEWISGRPRNFIEKDRKGFLGPVMQALLANAMGSEKSKMPLLAQAFINNVIEKHILVFFPDAEIQKSAELINIAGQISNVASNIDYIHLNDANFSSAKSNIFIRQKIKHEINVKNGTVEHKITVTYTNPSPASNCNLEKGDLCLNAPKYRNLFRWYVSPNSKLIKMTGSEVEPVIYDELNKKVFEGFYGNKYPLYAETSSKTSIQYTSSVPASQNYTLLLQKQPGTKPIDYELFVNGQKFQAFVWNSDKTIKLSL